ncbi:hypothetical protein [Caulobacter sp. NIBR2454]|uniref:hypothetical protein n=1 Tax=Caulobacter sp. NIBR2454 TaxID=3015996 RepID=UPI0022B6D2E1|nr:hypothetical protein [Caulobacter sp. NIBR2454]
MRSSNGHTSQLDISELGVLPAQIQPLSADARLARELVNIATTHSHAYAWPLPELRRQLKMEEESAARMATAAEQLEGRRRLVAIWIAGTNANRALQYEAVLRERTTKAQARAAA